MYRATTPSSFSLTRLDRPAINSPGTKRNETQEGVRCFMFRITRPTDNINEPIRAPYLSPTIFHPSARTQGPRVIVSTNCSPRSSYLPFIRQLPPPATDGILRPVWPTFSSRVTTYCVFVRCAQIFSDTSLPTSLRSSVVVIACSCSEKGGPSHTSGQ